MVYTYYFSASNTTDRIVKALAEGIGLAAIHNNITKPDSKINISFKCDDIVIFAAPVFGGRIPAIAAERFRQIKGEGQKCIVVATYGNRDYDDALVEMCDLASEGGFSLIAAGALIAQHSIVPAVAASRPDRDDLNKISEFASEIKTAIAADALLDRHSVKGNRPYKIYGGVPLQPVVDNKLCDSCGKCMRECPVGAITSPESTDSAKCISCTRCIVVCPNHARKFGGLKYKAFVPIFKLKCSARREPEWFVGK